MQVTKAKKLNWIGVNINPPDSLISAAKTLRESKHADCQVHTIPGVDGEDPYHITVCYGFDPKFYPQVVTMVEEAKLHPADLTWGEVYSIEPPHLAEKRRVVICVDVTSDKLQVLKAAIEKTTSAVNPAEQGRVIPFHVVTEKSAMSRQRARVLRKLDKQQTEAIEELGHARTEYKVRNYTKAIQHYETCILYTEALLDAEDFFQFGYALDIKKNRKRAIDMYTKCLDNVASHREARAWRCECLRRDKQLALAMEDAQVLVREEPNWAQSWQNRGLCYRDTDRVDKAIADFDKVLEINPEHAYASMNKAILLMDDKKDINGALPFLQIAYQGGLTKSDRRVAELRIADILIERAMEEEKWQEVLRLANEDLKRADAKQECIHGSFLYFQMGCAHTKIRNFPESTEAYTKSLELVPDWKTFKNRAIVWKCQQNWNKALSDYQEAIRLHPSLVELHEQQHNMLLNLGRFEDSLIAIRASCQTLLPVVDLDIQIQYGHSLCLVGKYDEAIDVFQDAFKLCEDRDIISNWISCARFGDAWVSARDGVWEDVVELYPRLFQEYGLDLKADQSFDDSFVHLERVSEYGQALYHLSRYKEALFVFEYLKRWRPREWSDNCDVRRCQIMAMVKKNQYQEALREVNLYCKEHKEDVLILKRCEIHYELGNFTLALDDLLRYMKIIVPTINTKHVWRMALIYSGAKRYDDAAVAYEYLLSHTTTDLKMHQESYDQMKKLQTLSTEAKQSSDPRLWSIQTVLAWIRSLPQDLRIYFIYFEANEISGRRLLTLGETGLQTMGIRDPIHRTEILKHISDLKPDLDHNGSSSTKPTCCVCYDKPVDVCFSPCHHVNTCQDCAKKVTRCPICRADIKGRDVIYL